MSRPDLTAAGWAARVDRQCGSSREWLEASVGSEGMIVVARRAGSAPVQSHDLDCLNLGQGNGSLYERAHGLGIQTPNLPAKSVAR